MSVYKCVSKVQAALAATGIPKGQRNTQQNYNFRGIDDILSALAPLIAEHGLLILPFVKERTLVEGQSKGGGTLFYTTLKVEYSLVSVEDGSAHVVCAAGEAMDSGDKGTNKAMSSAFKNMAIQAFCIPTQGDNDTENHSPEWGGGTQQQPRQPQSKMMPECPQCGSDTSVDNSKTGSGFHCFKKLSGCGASWE